MNAVPTPHLRETVCLNCGQSLNGPYCQACGQKAGGPPLHFHDFTHELVHEFLHFDSKIWQTLKLLLFSPGTLSREYIAGRRARYIGPVRLFLVASIALFGLLSLAPVQVQTNGTSDAEEEAELRAAENELRQGVLSPEGTKLVAKIERAVQTIMHDPEHAKARALGALSKSFFVLVPIFALVSWLFFAKRQPYYVGHMYFALHFHAFAFLLLSVAELFTLARVHTGGIMELAVIVALVAYFFVALRRTFASSWFRSIFGGSAVLLICAALNGVVVLGILGVLFLL